MRVGYACLNIGIINSSYKTFRKNNYSDDVFLKTVDNNLKVLEDTIDYNIKEGIKVFRISSDLIPFGLTLGKDTNWELVFKDRIERITEKIEKENIRLSMHPGQYTVLNSKDEDIVNKSIEDLMYHLYILEMFKTNRSSKIVVHIGGVYGDKTKSKLRFIHNYNKLDEKLKERLVIENDDRSYNIEDVLEIGNTAKIPVVFDNLHNSVNKSNLDLSERELIDLCKKTWSKDDLPQKIHYSQNDIEKSPQAHSKTIDIKIFNNFLLTNNLYGEDIDIMLEVKDKNLSCVKAQNLIRKDKNIKHLEREWSKYKYLVLEHSHEDYLQIRSLLKDKDEYKIFEFYEIIDKSLEKEVTIGSFTNALDHVWGYFKDIVTEEESKKYQMYKKNVLKGSYKIKTIKKYILELAIKYNIYYILDSLYLFID